MILRPTGERLLRPGKPGFRPARPAARSASRGYKRQPAANTGIRRCTTGADSDGSAVAVAVAAARPARRSRVAGRVERFEHRSNSPERLARLAHVREGRRT